jgi:hypothetical protein
VTQGIGTTVQSAIERVLGAYAALAELGEEIDDEWSYVQDLAEAWRERLDDVAAARGPELVDPLVDAAIDRAIDEIGRIEDPHRAIDWLSTFPQVTLLAFGERP